MKKELIIGAIVLVVIAGVIIFLMQQSSNMITDEADTTGFQEGAEEEIIIENESLDDPIVEQPVSLIINGLTLDERLEKAYGNIHAEGSTDKIRLDFPDIELTFSDIDERYPSEILPFEHFYSKEADKTFNFCAIERTVWICDGKIEARPTDEDLDDTSKCSVTSIYSEYT